MGSLFVVSGSGLFLNRENISKIHAGEQRFLQTYRAIDCSLLTSRCNSVSFTREFLALGDGSGQHAISHLKRCRFCRHALVSYFFPGFQGCCRSQCGLDRPAFTANNSSGGASMGEDRNNFAKRKFSLRLRPRLRLLSMRLRSFCVQSILNELRNFVLKNIKRLAVSTSFVVLMGLCYLFFHLATLPSPKTVPYSDMVASLQNGLVSKVLFEEGSRRICYNTHSLQGLSETHTLENESSSSTVDVTNQNVAASLGRPRKEELLSALRKFLRFRSSTPEWQYSTRKIDHDESFLLCLIRDKEAVYCSAPQSAIMSLRSVVVTVLSLWIPLTPLLWLLHRQLSAANSPARKRRATTQAVRFDDVEGVDGAKVELMEIIACLKGVTNYGKLGAKLPRGVLLIGPPGTGKTLLARAVAGEAGVPFFSVSASEFVELFVGRGAARMRDLFHVARKSAPSIIFIDELDAVGGKRGRSFNDERDQTLNQLLTEMDGFDSDMNVVVIAATNRPEALDPALCRPGRFSRKVVVGEPDEAGRRKILTVHFRGVPLEGETITMCNFIASLTQGFVGADLANLVNEAALLAARRGGETVTREDIMEAIERANYGINVTRPSATVISREIGKLFPWIPAVLGRTGPRRDGPQGPAGYQVLS